MPNDTLAITISNGDPNPNGAAAVMSRSGADHPNKATWRALDKQYTVELPANVWSAPPGSQLTFDVAKGATSAAYTLKSNAPLGEQDYTINPAARVREGMPKIMVEP